MLHLDDFNIAMRDAEGEYRTWKRSPSLKVEKHDPYEAHAELLDHYTELVSDGAGAPIELRFTRLSAMFRVGSELLARDGLIDTGSVLTVFPEKKWREFEDEIEWLTFPPGHVPGPWWTTVSGVSGGL